MIGGDQLRGALPDPDFHFVTGLPQVLLQFFPLGGVANGAQQCVAVGFTLDEIVLGPVLHRGDGQGLVIQTGDEHERDFRSLGVGLAEGLQTLAVRQRQVQEDQIDVVLAQILQALGEPGRPFEGDIVSPRLGQHLPDEAGVAGVIFDEQNLEGSIGARYLPGRTPSHCWGAGRWVRALRTAVYPVGSFQGCLGRGQLPLKISHFQKEFLSGFVAFNHVDYPCLQRSG